MICLPRTLIWGCRERREGGGQNKGKSTALHLSTSAGVDAQGDLTLSGLTPQLFQGNCPTLRSYDDYLDTQQGKICFHYQALQKKHCTKSHCTKPTVLTCISLQSNRSRHWHAISLGSQFKTVTVDPHPTHKLRGQVSCKKSHLVQLHTASSLSVQKQPGFS